MELILCVVALPAVLACAYLLLLCLLSAGLRPHRPPTKPLRFDIIVPAHDEAAVIQRSVASLLQLDWRSDRFRVLVVADNCSDATALLARRAGAEVLERHDPVNRGKGYALACAFARSLSDNQADAVVVVDADSKVSPNLLQAFAARIEGGAEAMQSDFGVLNPQASWRTRLMTIADGAIHILRSRARERLGVSCGIRGNGWCVTHRLLQRVPYAAFSLAEDLQYGIDLGLAGVRVHYVDEAHVQADMVTSARKAESQRQRWESGRFEQLRSRTLPLLATALQRNCIVCLDLAADLLVLPLSWVVLNVVLLGGLAGFAAWLDPLMQGWLWLALGCSASLLLYVLRGWQLSGVGPRGLLDLSGAPFFIGWKLLLMLKPRSHAWIRTEREAS